VRVARDAARNGWLGYACLGLGLVTFGLLPAPRVSWVRLEPLVTPTSLL
jgi:hypothetical protein